MYRSCSIHSANGISASVSAPGSVSDSFLYRSSRHTSPSSMQGAPSQTIATIFNPTHLVKTDPRSLRQPSRMQSSQTVDTRLSLNKGPQHSLPSVPRSLAVTRNARIVAVATSSAMQFLVPILFVRDGMHGQPQVTLTRSLAASIARLNLRLGPSSFLYE